MKKVLLAFLSFLPSIVFAQRTQDIGELIFRDILRMTEYPGAPFTGNIINDLVMMLFIPSVFIIIVVYTLVGRLTPHPKLNLLLSLAFYMFIVFGGYFRIFALLAGPYFLFLLIIMGLLFFFLGHIGLRRGAGMPGHAAGGGLAGAAVGAGVEGNLINEYESILRSVQQSETSVRDLEAKAAANPQAFERALALERQNLNQLRRDLSRMELEANKLKLGHGFQTTLKELRHRYGLR